MTDPRPDLKGDTVTWGRLLTMAQKKDAELAGRLHGFRCAGLRLTSNECKWSLRPSIGEHWETLSDYMHDRKTWLLPYTGWIIELLKKLEGS